MRSPSCREPRTRASGSRAPASCTPGSASRRCGDLAVTPLRELNQRLHHLARDDTGPGHWRVLHPNGAHALACGLDADVVVEIEGHAGYYCAGMNKRATVRVRGSAGTGVAGT